MFRKLLIKLILKIMGAKTVTFAELWNKDTANDCHEMVDGHLKFIETNQTDQLILTPSGFKPILQLFKTVPYYVYQIHCGNQKVLKCADKHLIFNVDKNCFVHANTLKKHDRILSLYGVVEVSHIIKTNKKEHMYDMEIGDLFEHTYYTDDILSHNTTTVGAYLLWFAAFSIEPVTVLVVSNKGENAKEIIDRIKTMYESMPLWLKPGVTEDGYNKHSMKFDNGSRIISQATSDNTGRGLSITLLFCHDGENTVDIMLEDGTIKNVRIDELSNYL